MARPAVDLPDPLHDSGSGAIHSADDLLAQLAGEEIDRLLSEADDATPHPQNTDRALAPTLAPAPAAAPRALKTPAPSKPTSPAATPPSSPATTPAPLPAATTPTFDDAVLDATEAALDDILKELDDELPAPADEYPTPAPAAPIEPPSAAQPTKPRSTSADRVAAAVLADPPAIAAPAPPPPPSAADALAAELEADEAAHAAALTRMKSPAAAAPAPADLDPTPAEVDESEVVYERVPLIVRVLEWVNAPLASLSDGAREAVGKIALVTTINALAILTYVLLFRRPG